MPARKRVAVVHGVNLDQLGRRDPGHYGGLTLRRLESEIDGWTSELDLQARFFQTNHEGTLVEYLHRVEGLVDAMVINPGAWTHYAWAIHDALELANVPTVEVHLSDVESREPWRQHSVISSLCLATIVGRGTEGYHDALRVLREHLDERQAEEDAAGEDDKAASAGQDAAGEDDNAASAEQDAAGEDERAASAGQEGLPPEAS